MEILVSKKLRQIIRFSKQQLIDCVIENYGCDGGDLKFALTYIMDEGLALERDYPFTGKDGECLNVTDKYIVKIRELQLMNTTNLIRSGLKNFSPLATYFYAPTGLELYEGGVLEPPPEECQDIERLHAAVIVGYNGDELLMRNSWGPDWGEKGNFWIKAGLCGLGNETYAISEWMNLAV
ncbi:uncharacterized protein [Bemisia tabaci]|uniref:uncharacterized protein n=1 Tax=Bemisia tabaci TaxID=7038 RepID=UPI003B27BD2C